MPRDVGATLYPKIAVTSALYSPVSKVSISKLRRVTF